MEREQFIEAHPTLLHMADRRAWESIQRLGLLSTSALLDAFGIRGKERERIECLRRPESMCIPAAGPHPQLGFAFIRDQHPLQPAALDHCLTDLTPRQWLRLLNARVYFWSARERLKKMLGTYARHEQIVLEIDTRALVERHGDRVELSRINTGFAMLRWTPAPRGSDTFVRLADFPIRDCRKIAEVTVLGGVPDILACTHRVTAWRGGKELGELWIA